MTYRNNGAGGFYPSAGSHTMEGKLSRFFLPTVMAVQLNTFRALFFDSFMRSYFYNIVFCFAERT